MRNMPTEYLYVDKDGSLYLKKRCTKKYNTDINPYTLNGVAVVFNKECTVQTIFDLVEKNTILKSICFYAEEFIAESKEDLKVDPFDGKLEFYWFGNDIKYDDEFTSLPMMSVGLVSSKGENCSIEFSPVNSFKHLPISFNYKRTIYKDFEEVATQIVYPTLFEVVYGLFWEISFHGDPKERDEKAEELFSDLIKISKESD